MVVYIKLDGSVKIKGSFTPFFARGKINQSISMKPGQSQGELVGTTQNIDQVPTSAGTRVNGALEAKGVFGVAVSADLIVGGVRPLSVTSELLAVERTQSYIGTAELVWYPEVSLSGYYCSKGQTRVYSSFGIAGAASLGLKSLDGEKVAELGGDFNWKRSKDWYQIPSGDNKCSSVTPPVVAVSELGQGTGTQAGKKAVGFNYASTPDALKLMADSWIVNVLSPGGRSLVTELRAGTPEQLVGYVDAGVAHQFTVTAYSSTYGDIAVSPPINFTTTPLAPQHIPVSISGLSATQTQPGGAVAGGFTVEGSDVQAIRVAVRVLNSNTPVPACWTNLRPQLGYRGFSFSGDWGGTAGACAALMPAQGESRTLEFLFEVTDSKGNSAGVCSAPPGGGPGECTSPVVRVLVQGVSVNPVTCSTGSAPDPDGICRAIATATSVSPAAGMIGVDKEFVISGTNFPSTAAVAIQDAYCWAPYLRTTTTIKVFL